MIKPIEKSVFVICIAMALAACGNNGGGGGGGGTNSTPGSLDTGFGTDGKVTTAVGFDHEGAYAVAIQSDGKIVAAGDSNAGPDYDFAVVRYNSDGSLDTTFNFTGKVTTPIGPGDDGASAVAIQSDGRIVVAGFAFNGTDNDFAVVRYNADGSLDSSFDAFGVVTTNFGTGDDEAFAVAIQSDGKIVVAGDSYNGANLDIALVRYNANGSLDTSFNGTGKVTTAIGTSHDEAFAVAIQSDGKIVVAGDSNNGADFDFAVVRYNSDGGLDTSFNGTGKVTTGIGLSDDEAFGMSIQSDGKIVAAGSSNNGTDIDFAVVRYNTNGSLDTSFGTGGYVTTDFGTGDDEAFGVAIQSDGKIVAAGESNNGADFDFAVVRYNTNGSLDTGFGTGGSVTTAIGPLHDEAFGVAIQSDGKIVAAGDSYNGTDYDFAVVRYWP
jgi:uncharacterized delta-60 repeat protein